VAEYEETLRSCLDEVQRIQNVIEELLELARIDTSAEHEPAEAVAVGDLVDAAVVAVRPRAEQQAVAVVTDRLPNVLVNAVPVAAKVALANILDNAVKFSPPGGQVGSPSPRSTTRRSSRSPTRVPGSRRTKPSDSSSPSTAARRRAPRA
jgi:signal transduction histidine kinase